MAIPLLVLLMAKCATPNVWNRKSACTLLSTVTNRLISALSSDFSAGTSDMTVFENPAPGGITKAEEYGVVRHRRRAWRDVLIASRMLCRVGFRRTLAHAWTVASLRLHFR